MQKAIVCLEHTTLKSALLEQSVEINRVGLDEKFSRVGCPLFIVQSVGKLPFWDSRSAISLNVSLLTMVSGCSGEYIKSRVWEEKYHVLHDK